MSLSEPRFVSLLFLAVKKETMAPLPKKQSAALSAILFLLTFCALQFFASTLASTPALTIVGGFVSSFLFFFALMVFGSLEKEVHWIEVIFCFILSIICAATVHRVCATTCFLFSVGILLYTIWCSKRIAARIESADSSKGRKGKK